MIQIKLLRHHDDKDPIVVGPYPSVHIMHEWVLHDKRLIVEVVDGMWTMGENTYSDLIIEEV